MVKITKIGSSESQIASTIIWLFFSFSLYFSYSDSGEELTSGFLSF